MACPAVHLVIQFSSSGSGGSCLGRSCELGSFLLLFPIALPGSTKVGLWILEDISILLFFPCLVSVYGPVLLNVSNHFFESPEIIYLQKLEYLSSINSSPEWWVISHSPFSSLPPSHWLHCCCDHRVSCFNSLKQQKGNLCLRKNVPHPQVLQIQQE